MDKENMGWKILSVTLLTMVGIALGLTSCEKGTDEKQAAQPLEQGKSAIQSAMGKTGDAAAQLSDKAAVAAGSVKETTTDVLAGAKKQTEQLAATAAETAKGAAGTASDVSRAVHESVAAGTEKLKDQVADAGNAAKDSASKVMTSVTAQAKETADTAGETVKQAAGSAAAKAGQTLSESRQALGDTSSKAAQAVAGAATGVRETAASVMEKTKQAAGKARDIASLEVSEAGQGAKSALSRMAGLQTYHLPDGQTVQLPKDSPLSGLLAELESGGLPQGQSVLAERLRFSTGSAQLTSDDQRRLDALAAILKNHPDMKVIVHGYTDSTGDVNTNAKLAAERARAVEQALLQRGIAADRIIAEGKGTGRPLASNATAEGRRQNRRVDILVQR
ncbi:MAG TPA: hypothetical protein ENI90_04845 [Methylothermaceae bacterium]|nr:hypothetical protein [Methylothermaceae bacterium]